jgi:hypothetical protein
VEVRQAGGSLASRLLAISQVASQPTLTQEGKLKLAIADLFI